MLDGLIQAGKIELHFNTEHYIIHKDSVSQERLMWSIGVVMAQSYVDSLRDNVKRSIDQKLSTLGNGFIVCSEQTDKWKWPEGHTHRKTQRAADRKMD